MKRRPRQLTTTKTKYQDSIDFSSYYISVHKHLNEKYLKEKCFIANPKPITATPNLITIPVKAPKPVL